MNKNQPEKFQIAWEKLASAFRDSLEETSKDEAIPFGFSTRMLAAWDDWRAREGYLRWERLSIRWAVGCTAFALVVAGTNLIDSPENSLDGLVDLPAMEEIPW